MRTFSSKKVFRPEVLPPSAPLRFAPENELGVVFLFSQIAKRYRLRIEEIRAQFPDCIAYQKTGNGEKRVRIEFEFKSRNFKAQKHSIKNCDWIVCWEHNWPTVSKRIRIIELRKEYDLSLNFWIQPVKQPYKKTISQVHYDNSWSVASQARPGDVVLFYHNAPDMCIKEIFVLDGPVKRRPAHHKGGKKDYMAPIRKICSLKCPVFLKDLKNHHELREAGFVRGCLRGRPRVTPHWPHLYHMILERNPSLKKGLKRFAPENI